MNNQLSYLFSLRLSSQPFTPEQQAVWKTLVSDPDNREQLEELLQVAMHQDTAGSQLADEELEHIINNITAPATNETNQVVPIVHRIHFLRTAWFRVAVIILLFSSIGAYLWQTNRSNPASTGEASAKSVKNDVMPGSDKAILILSDGRKITLDSTAGKTIAEGNLQIQNKNGQLIYQSATKSGNPVNPGNPGLNTMSTPKGGQYQLTLADGTRVWLNAASSITYPTIFTGNTRVVTITGEAYLEVRQDKQRPFIVKTADQKIEVLGTEFNVNTYADEKPKISLVNGAVKINNKVLKPGQALIDGNIQSTNIDQDIAWKNGVFNFDNKTIEQAMRQLARWYDVEIVYDKGSVTAKLSGGMDRKLTLQEALDGLNGVEARFTLTGRTVHVSPL